MSARQFTLNADFDNCNELRNDIARPAVPCKPAAAAAPDTAALLVAYRRDAVTLRQNIEAGVRQSRNAQIRAFFAGFLR